ncbi:hypothetical protein [Nocardia sp. NPDC058633]|uniref:hypothetical protein n=1 Tax=Nocardia sp. NPDC058633 TaxID=3346568 RepID=UPI003661D38D
MRPRALMNRAYSSTPVNAHNHANPPDSSVNTRSSGPTNGTNSADDSNAADSSLDTPNPA